MSARVLFVSKPIAPPFHDGTKCLVRDIASNLKRVQPIVMSTSSGAAPLSNAVQPIEVAPVYGGAGKFKPGLAQNLRAAAWLALRSRADVWHFVFAPNLRTSRAGRALKRLRRVPVLQTVASPPRTFDHIAEVLFGDVIVVQSSWTRERVLAAYEREGVQRVPRVAVIPPPVAPRITRSPEQIAAVRRNLDIPDGVPLFVYPGDLEVSRGAETVAELVPLLEQRLPGAITVFAYRAKTARAPELARRLAARLAGRPVRLTGEMSDVLALIAGANAVLFPVDDLWGKVDLPIVLLESMALGVPVIALDHGPLVDLAGAVKVPLGDLGALLDAALKLARDPDHSAAVKAAQRRAVADQYAAEVVAEAYETLYLELARRPS